MTLEKLLQEIKKGKFFTVEFIKRSNNERRVMNARFGVKKGLTGLGASFSFEEKNLLPVVDLDKLKETKDVKKSRRSIPIENIISISINKNKYFINDILINESINKIQELNKTILK